MAKKRSRKSRKKSTPSSRKKAKKTSGRSRKKTSRKTSRKKAPKRKGSRKSTSRKTSRKRKDAGKADEPAADAAEPMPTLKRRAKGSYATAESMARAQRDISVSEFFAKNRHLLGFDNPRKALLTTVKEAVDNALDACEEGGVLPEVEIAIEQLGETHFKVSVTDNGPGIVRKQIPSIFGRLLYGSKFHSLRMSRGQQGIGISAAGMYGLLTTGQPVRITSRTSKRSKAHYYELQIDTQKNRPVIIRDETVDWETDHGTRVEIELEARYLRGRQSVDDYLEQTAIANPHVTLVYRAPDGRTDRYDASVKELPAVPREVRPHPYGVELGVLIKMMQDTRARSVQQFLTSSFSRVSPRVAKEIIEKASLRKNARVKSVNGDGAKAIYRAIQDTKILAPSTDCVVPVGEEALERGLRQVVPAAFYTTTTRRPAVYRGNPFIIEAGVAYGRPEKPEDGADDGNGQQKTTAPGDEKAADDDGTPLAKVIRFANRVPLLYQQSSCAIYKSALGLNWKPYGIPQSRGALPAGPLTVVVHMASVWVPFTSESKEAIASYPEITREIRLALQECGRKLGRHVRRTARVRQELKKRSYIEKYIPAIGEALRDILDLKDKQVEKTCHRLKGVLERSRKM
jgi:DNA topoisomerase-6 subunit B